MSVKLVYPLPFVLTTLRTNKTLHGRSHYRPKDVPGHNVIRKYNSPGEGDAVDLFCASGTPCRAMHAGKITRIAEPDGRLGCIYLEGDGVLTVYAHLHVKPEHKLGSHLEAGQVIGYVNRKLKDSHLHLEVWLNGKALKARTGTSYRDKLAGML
jgi:murein DD-endopeptidase MepM/ murein hydrolase activator NlpD